MSGDEINAIRSLKLIGENSQNPMTGESRGRLELIRDLACSSQEDILSTMKQTSYEKAMQM